MLAAVAAISTKLGFSARRTHAEQQCFARCGFAKRWLVAGDGHRCPADREDELIETDGFPDWGYFPGEDGEPFEYKSSDGGWFDGRLVAVDYSIPAFDTRRGEGGACAGGLRRPRLVFILMIRRDLSRVARPGHGISRSALNLEFQYSTQLRSKAPRQLARVDRRYLEASRVAQRELRCHLLSGGWSGSCDAGRRRGRCP